MSSRIKLWVVRRWLRLLSEDELARELEWRFHTGLMNEAYEKMSQAMIDTYFKHTACTHQDIKSQKERG